MSNAVIEYIDDYNNERVRLSTHFSFGIDYNDAMRIVIFRKKKICENKCHEINVIIFSTIKSLPYFFYKTSPQRKRIRENKGHFVEHFI